jgi:hypothetical protein
VLQSEEYQINITKYKSFKGKSNAINAMHMSTINNRNWIFMIEKESLIKMYWVENLEEEYRCF